MVLYKLLLKAWLFSSSLMYCATSLSNCSLVYSCCSFGETSTASADSNLTVVRAVVAVGIVDVGAT